MLGDYPIGLKHGDQAPPPRLRRRDKGGKKYWLF
jgi:hypothetical protein